MHVLVKEWNINESMTWRDPKVLTSPHFGQALCLQDTAAQQIKSPPQTATLEFSRGARCVSEAFDAKLNKLLQKNAGGTVIWSCCPSRHVIFTYFYRMFLQCKKKQIELTWQQTWPDCWPGTNATCWVVSTPRVLHSSRCTKLTCKGSKGTHNENPQKFIQIHDP